MLCIGFNFLPAPWSRLVSPAARDPLCSGRRSGSRYNSKSSPERQIINNPVSGVWLVVVNGFTVNNGRDPFTVEMTLE